jgi:acetyltransferase-like isoleucine patch superfamily enzyme
MHPPLFDESFLKEDVELDEKQIREIEQIYSKISELYSVLRGKMMGQWNRCVPLNDLFTDRWEKARYLGFGEGSSISDSSLVLGGVKVGENTWIGPFTVLDGSGGLEIGSFSSISAGVQIYTHDSVNWAISGGEKEIERASTKIGSRCYLGPNTIIAKGVTIGDGCIVGANSLVLEDIPQNSKAVGTPCRVVGKIEKI